MSVVLLMMLSVPSCKEGLRPEQVADLRAGSKIWLRAPDAATQMMSVGLGPWLAPVVKESGVDLDTLALVTACTTLAFDREERGPPQPTMTMGWSRASSIIKQCAIEKKVSVELSDRAIELIGAAAVFTCNHRESPLFTPYEGK
ncbi:MAG: hypothetical protein QM723_27550 [Myxococcaceae bacterium]